MAAPASDTPVLDLLARMVEDSVALSRASLDPDENMLVRIAALSKVAELDDAS